MQKIIQLLLGFFCLIVPVYVDMLILGSYMNASNKKDKDKKTPIADGTFTKNIVFKEVLTP